MEKNETVAEINRLNGILVKVLGAKRARRVKTTAFVVGFFLMTLVIAYAGGAPKRW